MENIAVIGSVGYPSKQGKIEILVHHLVKELGNKVRFTIYCSTKNFPKSERLKSTFKLKLVYLPFKSKGFQGIIYDSISMIHALFFAKTFLILGVSTAFILPFLRLFTSKKLIISINCIEWKRQKRNRFSRLLLKWSENIAIRWAHSIVTDNDAIKQYLYAEYSVLCERIEYGADHVLNVKPTRSDYKKYPFLSNPYAFKVARIEQENNIDIILEAFTQINHNLIVVGNWNDSQYAIDLKEKYKNFENIILLDSIYEQNTLDLLRSNCWLYIHGHSSGGTNLSLIEAMYLGLPIFAFDVVYNKETTEYKCEYFNSVETLRKSISMFNFFDLKSNGEKMLEISLRRYTWKSMGTSYLRLFLLDKKVLNQNKKITFLSSRDQKYLQRVERYQLIYRHHYFEEID